MNMGVIVVKTIRTIVVMIVLMATSMMNIPKSVSMIILSQVKIIMLFLMIYIRYHVIMMIHRSSLSLLVHTNNKLRRHRNISTRKVKYGFKLSGCNILNNVGYLMTRNQYDIKGSRYVNHHIKKLCYVAKFYSIPLLYPE